MQRVTLREYDRSEPITLSHDAVAALQVAAPKLRVEVSRTPGAYEITADARVGVIRAGNVQFEIRPKIAMDRFFFILSYGVDPKLWRDLRIDFDEQDTVVEAVAPAFRLLVSRAIRCGLLHGYRTEEHTLPLVRGQIRFADQIRRHHGRMLPVELRFDEFTEDVLENQILLAALDRLRRLPLRSVAVQRGLNEIVAAFHGVSLIEFHANRLPDVAFSRLNQHYEPAINLALLILRSTSLELAHGRSAGTSFLINMNTLFETFVHRALREKLRLSVKQFPRADDTRLYLDADRKIRLKPDLSWWRGKHCRFVGDAKYKRIHADGVVHPDVYQLLAYTIATNLESGLLVYATDGDESEYQHQIRYANKQLDIRTVDLSGSADDILREISDISQQILMQSERGTISL